MSGNRNARADHPGQKMFGNSLEQFMRHSMSMRQLTSVELVNTYWQHSHKIADTGRMSFIIRGNVSWESDQLDGISSKSLWLKTNRFDPIGKHITTDPLRTYLQWYMNLYEIWGTININIDPTDAKISKPIIEKHIERIAGITNAMSLLFSASLHWIPALYSEITHVPLPSLPHTDEYKSWDCTPLRRSQDEHIGIEVKDEHILHNLIPFINIIEESPRALRRILHTALDWHASANRFSSGLNRFMNYWSSIELLGNYFYKTLPADMVQRKAMNQKRKAIMHIVEDGVTCENCIDVIRKCNEIREPSARTRMLAFLKNIANQEKKENTLFIQKMEKELFMPDEKSGKSLYTIRNDIAHGSMSEYDFEAVEAIRRRLFDAHKISREILIRSITKSKELGASIG